MFLNRLLTLLRDNAYNDTIFLSKEFFKDRNWFSLFLKQFNGVVFNDVRPISADLCLDACLTGLGVFMVGNVMPYTFLKISIIIQ